MLSLHPSPASRLLVAEARVFESRDVGTVLVLASPDTAGDRWEVSAVVDGGSAPASVQLNGTDVETFGGVVVQRLRP